MNSKHTISIKTLEDKIKINTLYQDLCLHYTDLVSSEMNDSLNCKAILYNSIYTSYKIVTFAMPLYPMGLYMHHYIKEKLVNVDTESHHNTP